MFPDDVVERHLENATMHLYSDDWRPIESKKKKEYSPRREPHLSTRYGHVAADIRENGRERDETRAGPIDRVGGGGGEETGDI